MIEALAEVSVVIGIVVIGVLLGIVTWKVLR